VQNFEYEDGKAFQKSITIYQSAGYRTAEDCNIDQQHWKRNEAEKIGSP
jgi:hypothetical protein